MHHTWPSEFDNVFNASDPVGTYLSSENLPDVPECVYNTWDETWNIFPMHADPFPLWNCALYANITSQFRLGRLSEENVTFLVEKEVDTSLTKAARITSTISACLVAHCENSEDCKGLSKCSVNHLSINGSMLNAAYMDTCVQSICASYRGAKANTDIAGVGILTSFIIQAAVILTGALALAILLYFLKRDERNTQTVTNKSVYEATAVSFGSEKQVIQHEQDSAHESRGSSRKKKVYDVLIKALIEFHKAECFLSMSLSVAALITLTREVWLVLIDQIALVTVGGVSILLTTFSLYILASFDSGRKSWYLYILSLCTWILGLYIALSPHMTRLKRDNKEDEFFLVSFDEYPNACGNTSPYDICSQDVPPHLEPELTFYYTLCLPIMFGLTAWQLSSISKISSWGPVRIFTKTPWLRLFIHLFAIAFFAVPTYVFFKGISDLFSNHAVNMTWGFGQVVAITVWVPTVAGLLKDYASSFRHAPARELGQDRLKPWAN